MPKGVLKLGHNFVTNKSQKIVTNFVTNLVKFLSQRFVTNLVKFKSQILSKNKSQKGDLVTLKHIIFSHLYSVYL